MQVSSSDCDQKKRYLFRYTFAQPIGLLSPIPEHEEPSGSISRVITHSPLPDLIVERQKRYGDDEPKEFYDKLEVKMKKFYRHLFYGESLDDDFETPIVCDDVITDCSADDVNGDDDYEEVSSELRDEDHGVNVGAEDTMENATYVIDEEISNVDETDAETSVTGRSLGGEMETDEASSEHQGSSSKSAERNDRRAQSEGTPCEESDKNDEQETDTGVAGEEISLTFTENRSPDSSLGKNQPIFETAKVLIHVEERQLEHMRTRQSSTPEDSLTQDLGARRSSTPDLYLNTKRLTMEHASDSSNSVPDELNSAFRSSTPEVRQSPILCLNPEARRSSTPDLYPNNKLLRMEYESLNSVKNVSEGFYSAFRSSSLKKRPSPILCLKTLKRSTADLNTGEAKRKRLEEQQDENNVERNLSTEFVRDVGTHVKAGVSNVGTQTVIEFRTAETQMNTNGWRRDEDVDRRDAGIQTNLQTDAAENCDRSTQTTNARFFDYGRYFDGERFSFYFFF